MCYSYFYLSLRTIGMYNIPFEPESKIYDSFRMKLADMNLLHGSDLPPTRVSAPPFLCITAEHASEALTPINSLRN